jgi:hypothetical protein
MANGFSDGEVNALAVDAPDLFVGGTFTAYKGVSSSANRIAKLGALGGAIDTTFSPVGGTVNGFTDGAPVNALSVTATHVYVGGAFGTYRGAFAANRIAKLERATGVIDAVFSPAGAFPPNGFDGIVRTLGIATPSCAGAGCGPILLAGGSFDRYRAGVARGLGVLDPATGQVR